MVELDDVALEPLLTYLGYQRSKKVKLSTSPHPEGIEEEARCAAFYDAPPVVVVDPIMDNETHEDTWQPTPPIVSLYEPGFVAPTPLNFSGFNRESWRRSSSSSYSSSYSYSYSSSYSYYSSYSSSSSSMTRRSSVTGWLVALGIMFLALIIAMVIYIGKLHGRAKRIKYASMSQDDDQLLIIKTPKVPAAGPAAAARPAVRNIGVKALHMVRCFHLP